MISDAEMLDQILPAAAPRFGKHHNWDKVFVRVKPLKKKPN